MSHRIPHRLGWLVPVLLTGLLFTSVRMAAAPVPPELADGLVAHQASFWRRCETGSDNITSRQLFAYALALAEARQHPERLDALFTLAEEMQDRDPGSRTYGNFWWTKRDGRVLDHNAVDFCMRGGSLLWLKERDFMPPATQAHLEKILDLAVQGCRAHQVPPSYSNIAIMNAGDLILLGEGLGRPEVATEGYARLDRIFHYTLTAGIHEFNSPTYTGVDLDGLGMIAADAQREAGRAQARVLLELWWTDLALNWFPPVQRLAGAQSRTYDFLHGLGELDRQLVWNGWLEGTMTNDPDALYTVQGNWHPSASLRDRSDQFPRLVRESWGEDGWQSRTHYLLPDITLSTAATSYGGRMDMPLTVDFPGGRKVVRGYFIADGRNDPYGQAKISAGAQQKAFHLNPFWAAAQTRGDALGLVIYRDKDVPTNAVNLTSNLVLPLAADAFWLGDQRVALAAGQPVRLAVPGGQVLALRQGQAELGVRVPWTWGRDGQAAPVWLVYDGNAFGAVRLAVEHPLAGVKAADGFKRVAGGAAFWLRIADGLSSEEAFTRWRQSFAAAEAVVDTTRDGIRVRVAGGDGPVAVSAGSPWAAPSALEPAPTRGLLELNGVEMGRNILLGGGQ